jgi:3-isopropylmalate/(R)-2-methylmalate dehydratase small subunit
MIRAIASTYVVLPIDNIDTDIIIPARFLKVTGKAGLGRHLFANWRYAEDGSPRPEFVLNRPESAAARVLVAGDNFGCGSSREHAPWALADFGFRAVVSTSFASIFRNNCLKNGLLPIAVEAAFHEKMVAAAHSSAAPSPTVSIDLEARTITLADGTSATFPIEPFPRYCLLNGLDELSFLLRQEEAIEAYERRAGKG